MADYAVFDFAWLVITSSALPVMWPRRWRFISSRWNCSRQFGADERSKRWVPFLAALAWALHPLQTSAVIYISGRADPLAAAFGFLGLYFGLRSSRLEGTPRLGLTIAAGAALLLSALSKEAGLIFLAPWLVLFALRRNWKGVLRAAVAALFVVVSYVSLRLPADHISPPIA
ncbi:MAG: hypothetical protein ACR2NX_05665 [Chthoniobacterales bacterium]